MKGKRVLGVFMVASLLCASAYGQQRSTNPQGDRANRVQQLQAAEQAVSSAQAEAEVQRQLQQALLAVQRAQQMDGQDRINMLRELERTIVRTQELQRSAQTSAAARPEQAAALSQASAALQAAQAHAAAVPGQRGGRGVGIGVGQNAQNAPRLVVRQSALGGGLNVLVGGGAWWSDSNLVSRLGLSEDQRSRIERSFTNHRLNLEASRDNLQKEEAQLARLLDAEPFDRNAVQGQIFRVTNARGEMERENAAMTLEMREQMTRAQWNQLQALAPRATVMVDVPLSPVGDPAAGAIGVRGGVVGPGGAGGGGRGGRGAGGAGGGGRGAPPQQQ